MNPNDTPLPQLILQPGPPVPPQFVNQIANADQQVMSPNGTPVAGTPAVPQMMPPLAPPPPPPSSGRSVPVTPPAIAGMIPAA
eukprot:1146991-Amphidinium_carterae.2